MMRLLRCLYLASTLLLGSCSSPVVQKSTSSLPYVEAELAASEPEVIATLLTFFNDGMAQPPPPNKFPPADKLHHFMLFPKEVPKGYGYVGLPDDATLKSNAGSDPALLRYVSLPPEARQRDFFLYHPIDYYWHSEYTLNERPVDFTCHFIIHIRAAGPGRTHVEVLEYLPMVQVGRKFGPAAHGVGFGRVKDLRNVAPTTQDRVELLQRIMTAVANRQVNGTRPEPEGSR